MAAVTVDRRRDSVIGNQRLVLAQVDVADDADTFDSKLKRIETVSLTPSSNSAIGATISGGTVTFQTGGAETNVLVTVIGR